ncbi:hypothetical protein ACJMK2_008846 [Sinanodonta woodiana]|uniref:Uncharacterized protein n=1 Tax=Sinanodonta woodiana TaxID=1069815 RepID=A0ABD3VAM7_SINWO
MSSTEILQQKASNTNPTRTTLISVTTKTPKFTVEFPTPIPSSRIALTQLRVYYSWPNIRSEPYQGKPPNNRFVFSYKKNPTDKPESHTILLPTGAYDIEDINEAIIEQIEGITGPNKISIPDEPDKSPIEIHAKEALLSASIEKNDPRYSVDIYNSSIRTVLGWPEYSPGSVALEDLPVQPKQSDYESSVEDYHGYDGEVPNKLTYLKRLNDFLTKSTKPGNIAEATKFITEQVNQTFVEINADFNKFHGYLVAAISTNQGVNILDLDNQGIKDVIKYTEVCNKILADADRFNAAVINFVLSPATPQDTVTQFLTAYNLKFAEISSFKFAANNTQYNRIKLADVAKEFFPTIYRTWLNNLPFVHRQIPEPKFDDFYDGNIPDITIHPELAGSIKYLNDFSFLRDSDIYNKYSYEVFDGTETDILSKEEYRQHVNLVFRFALGDRGTHEYSIKDITAYFNNQREIFQSRLNQLRNTFQQGLSATLIPTRTTNRISVLQQQRELNQIIADMNYTNDKFLSLVYEDKSPAREKFKRVFSRTNDNIVSYKFPGWCVPELKKSLRDLISCFYSQIHNLWEKINLPTEILQSNNSPFKTGKHKSPNPVHITSTIAIHVIADVIQDSYSVDASSEFSSGTSSRANPGYILYTFSPNVSPGSLIVMNPPNLVYLATIHDSIPAINFSITDQNFSLIDLRGEQLQMTIEVKS